MIDTACATSQNCYVDLAPHYIGDVPRPPYRITDQPSYAPIQWRQLWPMPAEAPSAPPEPPDDGKGIFVAYDDLEALIRRVIREELGKLRITQDGQ